MKFVIVQFSPSSCCFLSIRFKIIAILIINMSVYFILNSKLV
jgi:hypothetical protein